MTKINHSTPNINPIPIASAPGDGVSVDGRVKVVDVESKLIGRSLGQQLDVRGLKALKMVFVHPEAMFHLITGRLAQMRLTNPVKYLEEINDLSSRWSHCRIVINEGQELIKTEPEQKKLLAGQLRVTIGKMATLVENESSPEGVVEQMTELAALCHQITLPARIVYEGDTAWSLYKLFQYLANTIGSTEGAQAIAIYRAASRICGAIQPREHIPDFLKKPLNEMCEQLPKGEIKAFFQNGPKDEHSFEELMEQERRPPPTRRSMHLRMMRYAPEQEGNTIQRGLSSIAEKEESDS